MLEVNNFTCCIDFKFFVKNTLSLFKEIVFLAQEMNLKRLSYENISHGFIEKEYCFAELKCDENT